MGSRSDEELIQDLAPGAVEELLDRYWAPVYRLARRFGLDEDAAQDAAQESFVRLLEHSQRFDPSRSFRAWFFQIVRNETRQRLRGERRRRVREEASARPVEVAGAAVDDEGQRLHEALQTLNPDQREVLALHYLSGLSLVEVAELTGIAKGTVDSRLHRGLSRLRETLQPTHSLAAGGLEELLRRGLLQAPPSPEVGSLGPPPSAERVGPRGVTQGVAVLAAVMVGSLSAALLLVKDPKQKKDGSPAGPAASLAPLDSEAHSEVASRPPPSPTPRASVSAVTSPRSTPAPENEPASPTPSRGVAGAGTTQPPARADSSSDSRVVFDRRADPELVVELRFAERDGRPIEGVRCRLKRNRHEAFGVGGGFPRAGPSSGPDGVLSFVGVGPGDYEVSFGRDGFTRGIKHFTKPSGERHWVVEATLTPTAEVVETPPVTPEPEPARVQVTIPLRWAPGATRERVAVHVFPRTPGADFVSSAVGAEEEAVQVSLRPGQYLLSVEEPEGPDMEGSFHVYSRPTEFEVPVGTEHTLPPVELERLAVESPTQQPPADAEQVVTLRLRPPEESKIHWGQVTPGPGAWFERDGALHPARAVVEHAKDPLLDSVGLGELDPDQLSETTRQDLELLKAAIAALDQAGIDELTVKVWRLPNEGARLWVHQEGFAPLDLGHVTPGVSREARFQEGGVVQVRVLDGAGQPRPDVELVLAHGPEVDSLRRPQRTGHEGLASWPHASPGAATLHVLEGGQRRSLRELQVEDGRLLELEVVIP